MITKFLEVLYTKIFINIIVKNSQTAVYVAVSSKKEGVKSVHKIFDTTAINVPMYEFITEQTKKTPFYYISVLDKSELQGAVSACRNGEIDKRCSNDLMEYKCFLKDWAFYTSKHEIEAIKQKYKNIGVDFIFSPFAIMAHFFKNQINNRLAMFVLIEESFISFTVFNNSKLLYAEYLKIPYQKEKNRSSEDYQRFLLIQNSLNTFYKDPKYESQFVETIYIADSVGVSSELENYLEDEMFLNVTITKIDLAEAMLDMAKAEINEI